MLKRFRARGFKSLLDIEVELPRLAVLFGPNAAGKSNLLDAIQALSSMGIGRTVEDALKPIRGEAREAFSLPEGGLPELLQQPTASFELSADTTLSTTRPASLRYSIAIQVEPPAKLTVQDEYLAELTQSGEVRGKPRIELEQGRLAIRKSGRGHPVYEERGQNHAMLSNNRYSGPGYELLDTARSELERWRVYYLEPRESMRRTTHPSGANDIGVLGEELAPYLYNLKLQQPRAFAQLIRTARTVIPSIESVEVDHDLRRDTLDIQIVQDGTTYSSRIVSEGTLRIVALCALATNPTPPAVIAFEEPENGVHPARIEALANLLAGVAARNRSQIIVTTHSPLFASTILLLSRSGEADIGLFNCSREGRATVIRPFRDPGALLSDPAIQDALTERDESLALQAMLRRGWLDD